MTSNENNDRARRAREALANYDEHIASYKREEALWHVVDAECTAVLKRIGDALSDAEGEATLLEFSALFAKRNGHGAAANSALEQANLAHAVILEILDEAGFDEESLRQTPPSGNTGSLQ
jgi:hypothetical protein